MPNLLNFYISHITSDNFDYQPDENTDKYIWRYLSSSNLVQINDLDVVIGNEDAPIDIIEYASSMSISPQMVNPIMN